MSAFNSAEAYRLPEPKGYQCAAGCGHSTAVHREAGCDVLVGAMPCDCGAPFGRIPPADPEPSGDQPFSPIVGAIFTQMITDSQATTNALLDIRRAQLRDLRAELYAVRQGVAALLGHPWTPSSEAISQAVFVPSQALREEYLERYAEEDE